MFLAVSKCYNKIMLGLCMWDDIDHVFWWHISSTNCCCHVQQYNRPCVVPRRTPTSGGRRSTSSRARPLNSSPTSSSVQWRPSKSASRHPRAGRAHCARDCLNWWGRRELWGTSSQHDFGSIIHYLEPPVIPYISPSKPMNLSDSMMVILPRCLTD